MNGRLIELALRGVRARRMKSWLTVVGVLIGVSAIVALISIGAGVRNAVLNRFHPINTRSDKGALLENYLFLKLKLKYPHDNIRFWRTTDGHELDFVISNDFTSGHSYEVKYSRDTFKKAKYKKFMEHYPDIPVEIVTHEKAVRM